mgnify:FL=1
MTDKPKVIIVGTGNNVDWAEATIKACEELGADVLVLGDYAPKLSADNLAKALQLPLMKADKVYPPQKSKYHK